MGEAERIKVAKAVVEQALQEIMLLWPDRPIKERVDGVLYFLSGRLGLDDILVARFAGEAIFSQQFDGAEATEQRQALLIAANSDDQEVFKFLLYADVGHELRTGGGAAPACTLRRVA
jgi:hypothetical protein